MNEATLEVRLAEAKRTHGYIQSHYPADFPSLPANERAAWDMAVKEVGDIYHELLMEHTLHLITKRKDEILEEARQAVLVRNRVK